MNKTIRTIVLAAPLATAALALGAAPALAVPTASDEAGIERPDRDPIPRPGIPGDPRPDLPGGGGVITTPKPCPTHGGGPHCLPDPDEPGGDEPGDGDQPGDTPGDEPGDTPGGSGDIPRPTRIDTGAGGGTDSDGGLALAWILAGGAVITVTGAAFAGRGVVRGRA